METTKTQISEIEAEISRKKERLAELETQHAVANREAEETRRRLTDGAGNVKAATAASTRATVLADAVRELGSRIVADGAQLDELQEKARREEKAAQLLALADHATTQYERIDELQRAAKDELLKTCQALLEEREALSATRRQFAETVGKLQEMDGPRSPDNGVPYQERVEVAAARLLRESGMKEIPDFEAVSPISGGFAALPAPLGFVLDQALTSTWHFLEREKKRVQASGIS